METMVYILRFVVTVAWGKREIIPAHLPQFSLARPGPAKHSLDVLQKTGRLFRGVYRICVLVESHVTALEKNFELIAEAQRVEPAGPTDENIFA
jgi:hypothetical protein